MKQTQVQSSIQPVQVQNRSHKNPVQDKQGAVDFLQILEQIFSGNVVAMAGKGCCNNTGIQAGFKGNYPTAPEATAKSCRNPGDGINMQLFYNSMQPALPGDLSTLLAAVTEETPEGITDEQALMNLVTLMLGETLQQIRENGQVHLDTFLPEDIPAFHGEIPLDSMLVSLIKPDSQETPGQVNAETGKTPGISQQASAILQILEGTAWKTQGNSGSTELSNRLNINLTQLQQVLQKIRDQGLNITNRNELFQLLNYTSMNQASPTNEADLNNLTTGSAKAAATIVPNKHTTLDYPVQQDFTNANREQTIAGNQLSAVLRSWLKNNGDTVENGVYQQLGSDLKATTGSQNAGDAVKQNQGKIFDKAVNRTMNIAYNEFNMNSLASTVTKPDTASITQRTEIVHLTLNTVDSTLSSARSSVEQAPAVRTEQPLFLQLAEAIRGQVVKDGQGKTHLRLQLHPESLGEVVVKVVYKDGNLTAHFQAATEGARQVIESSFAQLREALAAHQLNLQHSSVSTGNDHGSWAQESSGERNFNRPFGQQRGNQNNEQGEPLPETVIETQQTDSPNRLNHFV